MVAHGAVFLAFVVAATLPACGPGGREDDSGGDSGDGGDGFIDAAPGGPTADAGPGGPGGMPVVYAHTNLTLYKVDPDSFDVSLVGNFQFSTGGDQMTDIALDADGRMIGVSYDSVYEVDPLTAVATYKAPLSREFNGLSFLPAGAVDPGSEVLVGTTLDGSVWLIDPDTGTSTELGAYDNGWKSSGDIVSVDGFGTVATVNTGLGSTVDTLAFVDTSTGVATPIGTDTGFDKIWGLGFWKGKVFGFTEDKEFVLIDVTTGVATTQELGDQLWWGAGVTTAAPIIP